MVSDSTKKMLGELLPGTLFRYGGSIGLKTDYRTDKGAVMAYILGSGEMFWGGAANSEEQPRVMVEPIENAEELIRKGLEADANNNHTELTMNSLRESLADYAHTAWSGWMKYLFSKCQGNEDGSVTIPAWAAERWSRQMQTPYAELPEEEKDSDRAEADDILGIVTGEKFDGRHCCKIGCPFPADWMIVYGRTPDDYTESCTRHLGVMMTDSPEIRVYPINQGESEAS